MANSTVEALLRNPKVTQAKQLLLEALKEQQAKITDIRPPNPDLKVYYDDLLTSFAQCRGGKLYYPYIGCGLGNGVFVELLDGSVKYDFITGVGVHFFGHSHPDLLMTSIDAALNNTIMQGNLQQNGDSLALCELLIHASKMDHCFLTTSGVMASENALKIAFQKKYPANRILAFEHCFMGRTLATAQMTDKPSFREGLPINYFIDYLPFYDPNRPEESSERAITSLKTYLKRYPKQHAVMSFEFVQGEGGFHVGTRNFFEALMKILKEHEIAIFADEVQTFGRTSQLFAYQHFELQEYIDIASIGKLTQVCATLFKKEFAPRPGLLSQTFTGSTSAIHASHYIVSSLLKEGFFGPEGKNIRIHNQFEKNLKDIAKRHPRLIQGPYGIGAMIAFTPYDGESKRVEKYLKALFEAGVIGFIAGSDPARVRFLPPAAVITPEHIDRVCEIIEKVLIEQSN